MTEDKGLNLDKRVLPNANICSFMKKNAPSISKGYSKMDTPCTTVNSQRRITEKNKNSALPKVKI